MPNHGKQKPSSQLFWPTSADHVTGRSSRILSVDVVEARPPREHHRCPATQCMATIRQRSPWWRNMERGNRWQILAIQCRLHRCPMLLPQCDCHQSIQPGHEDSCQRIVFSLVFTSTAARKRFFKKHDCKHPTLLQWTMLDSLLWEVLSRTLGLLQRRKSVWAM